MNMTADVYSQKNGQTDSGAMTREWAYEKTIPCKALAIKDKGGKGTGDDKKYDSGKNGYSENLDVKLQSPTRLSKRSRVTGIKSSDGQSLFVESEKYDLQDTIFDIISNHPVLDPFGKVAYYEINLRRAQVQNNDITAV